MFLTPLLHVSNALVTWFQARWSIVPTNFVVWSVKISAFLSVVCLLFFSISKILASRFLVNLQDKRSIFRHHKNSTISFYFNNEWNKKNKFIWLKNSFLSFYSLWKNYFVVKNALLNLSFVERRRSLKFQERKIRFFCFIRCLKIRCEKISC